MRFPSLLVSWSVCALLVALPSVSAPNEAREVAERARTKVVILKMTRTGASGSATGFLAGPSVALTAGHVVRGATGITAWVNGVSYPARVLAVHPGHDLAALRLETPELLLKPVSLAVSSAGLQQGEPLVILAGPSQGPAAKGEPNDRVMIPAALRRRSPVRDPDGRVSPMLTLDASVERGDSGSPVLRVKDGTVVGVVSSRELPDAEGVSHSAYAVPVEAINTWLQAVVKRAGDKDEEFYLFQLGK